MNHLKRPQRSWRKLIMSNNLFVFVSKIAGSKVITKKIKVDNNNNKSNLYILNSVSEYYNGKFGKFENISGPYMPYRGEGEMFYLCYGLKNRNVLCKEVTFNSNKKLKGLNELESKAIKYFESNFSKLSSVYGPFTKRPGNVNINIKNPKLGVEKFYGQVKLKEDSKELWNVVGYNVINENDILYCVCLDSKNLNKKPAPRCFLKKDIINIKKV